MTHHSALCAEYALDAPRKHHRDARTLRVVSYSPPPPEDPATVPVSPWRVRRNDVTLLPDGATARVDGPHGSVDLPAGTFTADRAQALARAARAVVGSWR